MGRKKKSRLETPARAGNAVPEIPNLREMPAPQPLDKWRWLKYTLAVVEPLSIAALFIFLLWKSWLRWGDPLVDHPRDLYTAWQMGEGAVLYRDITTWYGPLSHLVQSFGFKQFGVGLHTLIWLNIAVTAGVLLLLRGIFGLLGHRLSVWLVSVVFLSVFAFGDYVVLGNYNFIVPYASQATYSFLGLLLAVWGLLKHLRTDKLPWLGVAGVGMAVAYLDKPEATLAAAGALAVYFTAQTLRRAREGQLTSWSRRAGLWLVGGFLALWLPVFIYFWARSDLSLAWRAANFVPYSVMNDTLRHLAQTTRMLQITGGWEDPWVNYAFEFKSSAIMLLLFALQAWAARAWSRARLLSPGWWCWLLLALVPTGIGIYKLKDFNFWERTASGTVLPVCVAAAVCVWWSLREARRGGG